jgi:hypothetical protein
MKLPWMDVGRWSDALAAKLRTSADSYLANGQRCWPGADHFLLLRIDGYGCLTGESKIVCRACVREAAQAVLTGLDNVATKSCRQCVPYFELVGEMASADGPCSFCDEWPCSGAPIVAYQS